MHIAADSRDIIDSFLQLLHVIVEITTNAAKCASLLEFVENLIRF